MSRPGELMDSARYAKRVEILGMLLCSPTTKEQDDRFGECLRKEYALSVLELREKEKEQEADKL